MGRTDSQWATATLGVLMVVLVVLGMSIVPTSSTAQSIPDTKDIALGSESTTQSVTVEYELPGGTAADCTVDTEPVTSKGVDITSVSVSGAHSDHGISVSLTSADDVAVSVSDTDSDSEGTQQVTVTVTADTTGVEEPEEGKKYSLSCGGGAGYSYDGIDVLQTTSFDVKDTGIQETDRTRLRETQVTVEPGTSVTQLLDLDLVVPDDGDGDGDTYTVVIDTSEARTAGITVETATVENDPSGQDRFVAVEDTSVTADGNVSLSISEAQPSRSDGTTSQEVVTIALTLKAPEESVDETVTYLIRDDVGPTTAQTSFQLTVETTPTPTATPTATATPTPSTPPSPSPTASPTRTSTLTADETTVEAAGETATPQRTPSPTRSPSPTEAPGQPGFGLGVTLVAILLAGRIVWRRNHENA